MSQVPDSFLSYRQELRLELKQRRAEIPLLRHQSAETTLLKGLHELIPKHGMVLSYASFSSEFPTNRLNKALATLGRLALPKISGSALQLYHVSSIEDELEISQWGIPEPASSPQGRIEASELAFVFVPGLGFDRNWHRIGYGKGFYDRFLSSIPKCPAYGLGFKEQLVCGDLPTAPHDLQLSGLLLF